MILTTRTIIVFSSKKATTLATTQVENLEKYGGKRRVTHDLDSGCGAVIAREPHPHKAKTGVPR
jgi:hypothetical protein